MDLVFVKIDKNHWVKLSTITMFYDTDYEEKAQMAAHNAWVVTNAGSGDHYHRTSYTAEQIAEIIEKANENNAASKRYKYPESYADLMNYTTSNDFSVNELRRAIDVLENCMAERLDGYSQTYRFLKKFIIEASPKD